MEYCLKYYHAVRNECCCGHVFRHLLVEQLIPEHQSLLAPTMEFFSGVKHVAQGSEHFKDFIPDALPDTLPYIMLGTSTGSTLACDPHSWVFSQSPIVFTCMLQSQWEMLYV